MPTNAWSGFFPWKKQQQRFDQGEGYQWQAGRGTKRVREGHGKGNVKWYDVEYGTGGWSAYNKDTFDRSPKREGMYRFTLYNGRKTWVPGRDVDEHISFSATSGDNPEVAAHIEKAFASKEGAGRFYEFDVEGPSHISKVRYNPTAQVMEVTFGGENSDGRASRSDTVTFFRVPKEIMLTMEFSNGKRALGVDGKMRSMIGIQFWNLVRVRGSPFDARYPTYGGSAFADGGGGMSMPGSIGDNQYVDAEHEAAGQGNPSDTPNAVKDTEDSLSKAMASKEYTKQQLENIRRTKAIMEERGMPVGTKEYNEFALAVEQGMGSVIAFRSKHRLWDNRG